MSWPCPFHTDQTDQAETITRLVREKAALQEALTRLYKETADYITINHLGDVHHNASMQMARAALRAAKGETA